jgi:hypothetical protein
MNHHGTVRCAFAFIVITMVTDTEEKEKREGGGGGGGGHLVNFSVFIAACRGISIVVSPTSPIDE